MPTLSVSAIRAGESSRVPAYMDWLQMLTGASLTLFVWCHLLLVSSVIAGPGAMNSIAGFMESAHIDAIADTAISLVFLLHFVLAARKVPFRLEQQSVMWRHANAMRHGDTWLWVVQAVSGMVILIMGAIHIWSAAGDMPINAAKSALRVQSGHWVPFYVVLLPMVALHACVGLYRIGVKWGFIQRIRRPSLKKAEYAFTAAFVVIGLVTLVRFWLLKA